MIHIHKTVISCYQKISQVKGVFWIPIWATKTKKSSKTKKYPENQQNKWKTSELA